MPRTDLMSGTLDPLILRVINYCSIGVASAAILMNGLACPAADAQTPPAGAVLGIEPLALPTFADLPLVIVAGANHTLQPFEGERDERAIRWFRRHLGPGHQ